MAGSRCDPIFFVYQFPGNKKTRHSGGFFGEVPGAYFSLVSL